MPTLTETRFFPVPTRSNYFQIPTHENPRLKKNKKKKKKHDREDKLARMQAKMHASRKSYEPHRSTPGPRPRPHSKRRSRSHRGSEVQFAGQSNFDQQFAANMASQGGPIEVDDEDEGDYFAAAAAHADAHPNQHNEYHDDDSDDEGSHVAPQHQPHPEDGPFTKKAKEFGLGGLIMAFAMAMDAAYKINPQMFTTGLKLIKTEVEMVLERFKGNYMLSYVPFTEDDYIKIGLGAIGAALVAQYGAGGTRLIGWEGMLAAYAVGQKLDEYNGFKHYKFFTPLTIGSLIAMNKVVGPFIAHPQLRLPMFLTAAVAPAVAEAAVSAFENRDAIGEYAADTVDGIEQFTSDMAVGAFEAAQGSSLGHGGTNPTGNFDLLNTAYNTVNAVGQAAGNLAMSVAEHEASDAVKGVIGTATGLTLAIAGGAGF